MTITSFWVASALGLGREETLANLASSIAPGMCEMAGDIPSRKIFMGMVPAELPPCNEKDWDFRSDRLLELAVKNMPELGEVIKRYGAERVGVVLGASNTGIDEAERCVDEFLEGKVDSLVSTGWNGSMIELGTPARYLRKRLGVEGPAYVVSTACSSSAKVFASARRLLDSGICDAVITGGVDGRCRFAMNGFHALGALSSGRCRPLACDRDGINLGEGVALFVVERNGEGIKVAGVGESSDAYHTTAPDPEGGGAEMAMRDALQDAGLTPADVDYVNLHGTGTIANDAMEMKAVDRIWSEGCPQPRIESTKSLTGHCLGAAGAIEAAICCAKIASGSVKCAISNSFAFGGANASVVFAR